MTSPDSPRPHPETWAYSLSRECLLLSQQVEALFPSHHRAYPLNSWAREAGARLEELSRALADPTTREQML